MPIGDIKKLLEYQKQLILEEKKRLGLAEETKRKTKHDICDSPQQNNNEKQSFNSHRKENCQELKDISVSSPNIQNCPIVDSTLTCNESDLQRNKGSYIKKVNDIDFLSSRTNDTDKGTMLRLGEYSPDNPELRVTAAPYLGIGEYDQRKSLLQQKRRADYLDYLTKKNDQIKLLSKSITEQYRPVSASLNKAIQTDIQNINIKLIQYESHAQVDAEKELSPRPVENIYLPSNRNLTSYRVDQRLTSAQNALLNSDMMDKPKGILTNRRTGSPRDRLTSDLKHSYTPSFLDGFNYQSRADERETERLKREAYQRELSLQIEEKRRLQALRDEQERREQELENKRLEQQLLRMQEEAMVDDHRRDRRDEHARRHSEDLYRRRYDLQPSLGYRKHTDSESSLTTASARNTNVASKSLAHYSPPVSRRIPYSSNISPSSVFADPINRYNPTPTRYYDSVCRRDALNRMDSLYDNSYSSYNYNYGSSRPFGRFDSLSRIDCLTRQDTLNRIESLNLRDNFSNVQRRHSATHQDLRKSPLLQRRSNSSRFDDTLPIPVLKAHSPVAKELKNSVPFNSSRHSTSTLAARKLEDKWQIPAVQKTIVNHSDSNRSILTQLGAIRMQLQQEQLRMDETLRKRGITQSKAVDLH